MLTMEDKKWVRDEINSSIDPLKEDVREIKERLTANNLLIENTLQPLLSELTACYTAAERRFSDRADEIDEIKLKTDVCYNVMQEHDVKIKALEGAAIFKGGNHGRTENSR